jgi:large subunit ribosomal protein L15
MPTRFRKVRRQRGSRTHGWGQINQHRKSGSKGGTGRAGLHKHKWSWTVVYSPDHFGGNSLKPAYQTQARKWINVGQLDDMKEAVRQGEKELTLNLVEKGYSKLLGSGVVKEAYTVLVGSFTRAAKEKIEKAGGKIVVS